MAESTTNASNFKLYNLNSQEKKEPSLNTAGSKTCMKCGNRFNHGRLMVCPAKEFFRKNCNYRGQFAKLCKSKINVECNFFK